MKIPELFQENEEILLIRVWDTFCNYLMYNSRFMFNIDLINKLNINEQDRIYLYLLFEAIDFMVEKNLYIADNSKVLHRARIYYKEEAKKSINDIDKFYSKIIDYYKVKSQEVKKDEESYNYYRKLIINMEKNKKDNYFFETQYMTMKQIDGVMGFDVEDMKAPPKEKAKSGRINPDGIVYLYTSEDIDTCIAELKPYIGSEVSVIDIVPKKELKIFNISSNNYEDKNGNKNKFIEFLENKFSLPYKSDESLKYLPTQYITEYIRFKGLDGIRHKSSVADGYNVIIFNQDDVEFKSNTNLYHIRKIKYCKSLISSNIIEK